MAKVGLWRSQRSEEPKTGIRVVPKRKGRTCMRVRRTHERPGVAIRPRLTIDQKYVTSESEDNENERK